MYKQGSHIYETLLAPPSTLSIYAIGTYCNYLLVVIWETTS